MKSKRTASAKGRVPHPERVRAASVAVAWMRLTLLALVGAAAAGCAHVSANAPNRSGAVPPLTLDYDIEYRTQPHALAVTITLDGPARDFMFTQPGFVPSVTATSNGHDVELPIQEDGRVAVPPGTTKLHYEYTPDSGPAVRMRDLYAGAGVPGSFLVAGRVYLIRPRTADAVTATIHVRGANALLPWKPGADGAWHVTGMDLVDSGFHSFGGDRCVLHIEGAELEVALHEGDMQAKPEFLCDWVKRSAEEVLTVRRPFPYPRVAVHLMPGFGRSPSPLGLMLWSTPPSLTILVGERAAPSDFAEDWVAVHEMLHTIHPSFLHESPWIPEGIATYYQEVARMRSGRITREAGWGNLADDFQSGLDEAGTWTLQETEEGLQHGRYQPLYWAGALIALELDVELRRATGGTRSLDDALATLAKRGSTATIDDYGRAIDDTAGQPIFARVLAAHRNGPVFANAPELLAKLGVRRVDGHVTLTDAPDAAIRDAISARSVTSAAPSAAR